MELYRGPHRVVAVLMRSLHIVLREFSLNHRLLQLFCVGLPLHTWKFLYYLFNEVQIRLFVILFIITLSTVK